MEEKETKISLYDVLLILAKGKWAIIIPTICAMIFSFSFAMITKMVDPQKSPMPDRFTSSCEMIFLQTGNSNPFSQSTSPLVALTGAASSTNTSALLLQNLILGETFLLELAASPEFNLYEIYEIQQPQKTNLVNRLRQAFQFEIDETSQIMKVSYTDIDPELAWKILSKAIPLLEERYKTLFRNQVNARSSFIADQIKDAEDNLAKANAELSAFQKEHGIYDFQSQIQNQFSIYTDINEEILKAEMELEFLTEYRPKSDPTVVQKVKSIQKSKELLHEFETGSGRYSMNVIPMNKLQTLSAQYSELRREVELRQELYLMLRQQEAAARMEQSGEISSLQILEYPQIPEIKSGPSRGRFCIFITFAVIFLSTFAVFLKSFIHSTMENSEDREKVNAMKDALKFKKFPGRRKI